MRELHLFWQLGTAWRMALSGNGHLLFADRLQGYNRDNFASRFAALKNRGQPELTRVPRIKISAVIPAKQETILTV